MANDIGKLVQNYLNELWNGKCLEEIDRTIDPVSLIRSPITTAIGQAGMKTIMKKWFQAFPDIICKVNDAYKSENGVWISFYCEGKHKDTFCDVQPTGKKIEFEGLSKFIIEGDAIVEYHASVNIYNILQQITEFSNDIPKLVSSHTDVASYLRNINNVRLSKREVECISLWLCGKSAKETAQIMKIEPRTVDSYRSNAKDKLQVYSKSNLFDYLAESKKKHLFYSYGNDLLERYGKHKS